MTSTGTSLTTSISLMTSTGTSLMTSIGTSLMTSIGTSLMTSIGSELIGSDPNGPESNLSSFSEPFKKKGRSSSVPSCEKI